MTRFRKHKFKHRVKAKFKDMVFYIIFIVGLGFLMAVAILCVLALWCFIYGH